MMSKRQWFSLLCIFMCYILFGATVFYLVESAEEDRRLLEEENERHAIEGKQIKCFIKLGTIIVNNNNTTNMEVNLVFSIGLKLRNIF